MKAAVLENIGEPLRIIELEIPAVQTGQILVRMFVSGICGAQLQEIDGLKGDPSHCPHLLGHEGCGEAEGRKVVIHWRKGNGDDPDPPRFGDIKAGPCTTFSEYTVVSENRITRIPDDVPNDLAALLGCCLSTALATVESNVRKGDSVLVIGCGGVGLAMILAAKAFGAKGVVGTDREYSKWKQVKAIGGDRFFPHYTEFHWIDFTNDTDLRASIADEERRTMPYYDVIIDTVGSMSRDYLLKPNGRHIHLTGAKKNTEAGGFEPTRDIPRYIQMWRDGKLDGWEKIITHRISLDQINDGIALMRSGKAGRIMIEFK